MCDVRQRMQTRRMRRKNAEMMMVDAMIAPTIGSVSLEVMIIHAGMLHHASNGNAPTLSAAVS